MVKKIRRLVYWLYCRFILGESTGKIIAWEQLKERNYLCLHFEKDYHIAKTHFDFYNFDLHLAIDIYDMNLKLSGKDFEYKKDVIIKHHLEYISASSKEVEKHIHTLLLEIELYWHMRYMPRLFCREIVPGLD